MSRRQLVFLSLLLAFASPAFAAVGIPDAYGYIWVDQDEPFVDRSFPVGSGTVNIGVTDGGPMSLPIALTTPFRFYGVDYLSFKASDNGFITFDGVWADTAPTPLQLPNPGAPPLVIAWMWADLVPEGGFNAMHYEEFPGGIRIRYSAKGKGGANGLILAHVGLFNTGVIKIWYEVMNEPDLVSIGIQPDASNGHGPRFLGTGAFEPKTDAVLMFFPPAELDCDTPTTLLCDTPLATTSPPTVTRNVERYQCTPDPHLARERVFEFTVSEYTNVSFALTDLFPLTVDLDLLLLAPNDCSEHRCVDFSEASSPTDTLDADLLAPGTYKLVVDGKDVLDNGSYWVTATCDPRGATATCGSVTAGTTSGSSIWQDYSCTTDVLDGPEFVYQVTFTGPGNLRADLSNHAGDDTNVMIFSADALDPTQCLAYGDEQAILFDPPDGDYIIVIDGPAGINGSGDFDLTIGCNSVLNCGAPPALSCQTPTLGTTIGGPRDVDVYSCDPSARFTGPEAIYTFTHPGGQLSFILDAPPGLEVQIVDASCNEGRCMVGGPDLVTEILPAGVYYVVVDGTNAASGDFILTPLCDTALEPSQLDLTLAESECGTEHKTVYLTPEITTLDVLFAIDVSADQNQILSRLEEWADEIDAQLAGNGWDINYGLVSFADYIVVDKTTCGDPAYGADFDYPYRLDWAIGPSLTDLKTAMASLTVENGGDLAESYTRVWYETYEDLSIGWRPGSRRVVLMSGDDVPHDCDVLSCGGGPLLEWGADPGPNGILNDGDDLEILSVMNGVADAYQLPIFLFSPTGIPSRPDGLSPASIRLLWRCLTGIAGGTVVDAGFGLLTPESLQEIEDAIEGSAGICRDMELRASPGFENWLNSVTPPSRTDVTAPGTTTFDLEFCVPPLTTAGIYNFEVELVCEGRVLTTQAITAAVSTCGFNEPLAIQSGGSCAGESRTLDGSNSTIPGCTAGIEYQWLDQFRNPVPGAAGSWGAGNSSYTFTLDFNVDYIMQFRCVDQVECLGFGEVVNPVTVSRPLANAGPEQTTCVGQTVSIGADCDTANFNYTWDPVTDLVDINACPAIVDATAIPSPDPWIDYTVTVEDKVTLCTNTSTVRVNFSGSRTPAFVGNNLLAKKTGNNVNLSWTGGALTPPEYNVHQVVVKTDLVVATLPSFLEAPVFGGEAWDDIGGVPVGAGDTLFYQVYMQDCDGSSLFP